MLDNQIEKSFIVLFPRLGFVPASSSFCPAGSWICTVLVRLSPDPKSASYDSISRSSLFSSDIDETSLNSAFCFSLPLLFLSLLPVYPQILLTYKLHLTPYHSQSGQIEAYFPPLGF